MKKNNDDVLIVDNDTFDILKKFFDDENSYNPYIIKSGNRTMTLYIEDMDIKE